MEQDISKHTKVEVVDIDIGFWSMVYLLTKLAFALIPAAVLVGMIWYLVAVVLAAACDETIRVR